MTPDINKLLRGPLSRSCKYGAPLGRDNQDNADETQKRYCQYVRFVDGGYSGDGTYWGAPANLWCVFTADLETLWFTRAASRAEALRKYAERGGP
jgi:hypothetical protein